MSAESKLVELNLQLPPIPKPGGVYKPVVIVGNMAYCSGHVSVRSDGGFLPCGNAVCGPSRQGGPCCGL